MTPDEKDDTRAEGFAAKWLAEHDCAEPPRVGYPTDEAMAAAFAGCVRPPDARLYPLIRERILAEAAARDVWYRGARDPQVPGPAPVVIETPAGDVLGLLHNAAAGKSPDGFAWGYGGSGPAALARSILAAALGDAAKCPTCAGTQRIMWRDPPDPGPEDPTDYAPVPWDGRPALDSRGHKVLLIEDCYDCEDGTRHLPYQAFKRQHVGRWGPEFRIARSEVLAWLAAHGVTAEGGA